MAISKSLSILSIPAIVILTLLPSCKKENTDNNCGKTELSYLHQSFRLGQSEWGAYYPLEICNDTLNPIIPPYFNLTFGDSTYSFSYLLKRFEDHCVTTDSIVGEESGRFSYSYCYNGNVNANGGHYPGGYSRRGTISFYPDGGESYNSSFIADSFYPLKINHMRLGDVTSFVIFVPE